MTDETDAHQRPPRRQDAQEEGGARQDHGRPRPIEKGLLIVHTGKGKGKSTAAFGMVFRAHRPWHARSASSSSSRAHGRPASATVLEKFPDLVTIKAMGEGFTWETQDRDRDIAACPRRLGAGQGDDRRSVLAAWCCSTSSTSCCATTICRSRRCWSSSKSKPADKHVIVTGRNASEELIEIADLVTEMTEIKHPFRSGVKAQAGVEF